MAALRQIKLGETTYDIHALKLVNSSGTVYTVGNGSQLIKFNGGIPQVSTSNAGNASWPVYLSSGSIYVCTTIDEGVGTWTEAFS